MYLANLAGTLSVAIVLSMAAQADAETKVTLGCTTGERIPLEKIDHSIWDGLLKRYSTDEGRVDYAAWHKSAEDTADLDAYLANLSQGDPDAPSSPAGRLAYWINAYNAVTVAGILREYPTTSIRHHTAHIGSGYNIWRDLLLIVGDKNYSLEAIESEMLRPLGEKRVHFALVSASLGCPRLRNEAYVPERIDAQLADNACDFFARARNLRWDAEHRTFHVSAILHWFDDDFGSTPQEALASVAAYISDPATRKLVESRDYQVEFVDYDWTLNDKTSYRTSRK
jgi:hypothetical protein